MPCPNISGAVSSVDKINYHQLFCVYVCVLESSPHTAGYRVRLVLFCVQTLLLRFHQVLLLSCLVWHFVRLHSHLRLTNMSVTSSAVKWSLPSKKVVMSSYTINQAFGLSCPLTSFSQSCGFRLFQTYILFSSIFCS